MDGLPLPADDMVPAAFAADEPETFAEIYDAYFSRVYNYVRYRVHDAALADDLTAEVFERVLTRLDGYEADRAPFAAWLFGIARHAVIDYFRRRARWRWLPLDTIRQRASPEPGPEQVVTDNAVRTRLLEAVSELGERERDLIALKFAAGFSNRQIAKLTGLSESNVGVILYRSIGRLRDQLQDILPRYED